MTVKIGPYYYSKSTRAGKKLMVEVNGKTIHFGDSNMQQYHDKTGIWKHLDHKDKERRTNYLRRAGGIKNVWGKFTSEDPKSANYHSIRILW